MSGRALREDASRRSAAHGAEPAAIDGTAALPEDIIDAAITWVVKLDYNQPTPRMRSAFERWLQADPRHALAWQRMDSLKQPFVSVPPKLLRGALDNVDARREHVLRKRRNAMKLLSLAGLTLGMGWIVREQTPWQRLLADASTATGEQKTLHLADGTVIVLNTDSAVSIDLAGAHRVVMLRRGEILVTTGADAEAPARRPFWVHTPYGHMQALGTRFTVRLDDGRARVSVQEGAVEVHPAGGGATHVVRPDESRWLAEDGSAPADLGGFEADGWSDGVIAGRNIRLADLLNELSRYRSGRIICDERVAELQVSGLFHIANTDQALQFLAQTQPVQVHYHTRFWVTVGPEQSQ